MGRALVCACLCVCADLCENSPAGVTGFLFVFRLGLALVICIHAHSKGKWSYFLWYSFICGLFYVFLNLGVCCCLHACRESAEKEPLEIWWHADILPSNAATVLQCLFIVVHSLAVYDTMLCLCVCVCACLGDGEWGMKFCICEWVDKNSAS